MNSNGGYIQSNSSLDSTRPHQSGRHYRGGNRRGRSRQGEKMNRQTRDKRQGQIREGSYKPVYEATPINLEDDTQWPSIQQTSFKSGKNRNGFVAEQPQPRSSANFEESRTSNAHLAEGDSQNNLNYRRSLGGYRSKLYDQNQQGDSNYYGGSFRQYNDRFQQNNPNRRGNRNYNYYTGRGYYGGPKRYMRNSFGSGGVPMYISPPGMYVAPQFVETGNYNSQATYSDYQSNTLPEIKAKQPLDAMSQVEYYFSVKNLQQDSYMRRQMDSAGWVDLRSVYNFKRIKNMQIGFEEFIDKLLPSKNLEIDVENNKIRTKNDPEKWVLKDQPTDSQTSNGDSAVKSEQSVSQQEATNQQPSFGYPPLHFLLPQYPGQSRTRYTQPSNYYPVPYGDFGMDQFAMGYYLTGYPYMDYGMYPPYPVSDSQELADPSSGSTARKKESEEIPLGSESIATGQEEGGSEQEVNALVDKISHISANNEASS